MAVSNIISVFRLLLAFPLAYAVYENEHLLVAILGILVFVSDYADGYVARRKNEVTELGKVIDPVADKVVVLGVVFALMLSGKSPIWFVTAVVVRDFIILAASLVLRKKLKGYSLPSNILGKLTINILAGIFLFQYLEIVHAYDYGSVIGMIFLTASLMVYTLRAVQFLGKKNKA